MRKAYLVRATGILVALCSLAAACGVPSATEVFVPGDGPYAFAADLSDSTAVYDLALYARIDAPSAQLRQVQGLPLMVEWRSPSGERTFTEQVWLPVPQGRGSTRAVHVPYREGIRMVESGRWTLTVRLDPHSRPQGWQGLGLVVDRRTWDTEN